MIDTAWNEYRGWAKRARVSQAESRRWNLAAFASAAAAAILGAAANETEGAGSTTLSALAAVCAAATPILGHNLLSLRRESAWIRARAVAEAVKSECFRFAAGAPPYGGPKAVDRFIKRREDLTAPAFRRSVQPLALDAGDPARPIPPIPLDAGWYIRNRVNDQVRYYQDARARHETLATWLRLCGIMLAITGAALGALGSVFPAASLSPWIGVTTTFGGLLLAYGLMDRHEHLAVSYSATAAALDRLRERFQTGSINLPEFVDTAEHLMGTEHAGFANLVAGSGHREADR